VYADDDPVNEMDPSGKFTISGACIEALGGTVVAGILSYDTGLFIYNNAIAPACGFPRWNGYINIGISNIGISFGG